MILLFEKIQTIVAPIAVPIAPAVLLGSEVYHAVSGRTDWILALIAATFAAIGLEFGTWLLCTSAVTTLEKQQWIKGLFSLVFIGVYIAAGLWTISQFDSSSKFMILFFFLAPAVYFAQAFIVQQNKNEQLVTEQVQTEIELIKARTSLTNAEARKAKAEQIVYPPSFGIVRDTVRGEQGEQKDYEKEIYAILASNSNIGPREMSRLVGCSVSTASKWISKYTTSSTPKL